MIIMKLEELHFRNYRLFEKLDITGLKRINLIAGKNNTGKTALLEGIRIWAAQGDSTVVNHILDKRGEFTPSWDSSYKSLFFQNDVSKNEGISINKLSIFDDSNSNSNNRRFRVSIDENMKHLLDSNSSTENPADTQVVYIPYIGLDAKLQILWDNINLTDKEEEVYRILRNTVLPSLQRLGFNKDQFRLLLSSRPTPVPIGRFGDGVKRILGIALALANAQNKILLIDEFESGLHHSVQKQLWELVFHYAKEWNIQVFITTHSEDTLKNFFYAASSEANKNDAYFIRLQYSRTGILEVISYNMERLENALELDLEIR